MFHLDGDDIVQTKFDAKVGTADQYHLHCCANQVLDAKAYQSRCLL